MRRPTRAVISDKTTDGRPYLTVGLDRPAKARDVATLLVAVAEALDSRPNATVLHLAFDTDDRLASPSMSFTVYYEHTTDISNRARS